MEVTKLYKGLTAEAELILTDGVASKLPFIVSRIEKIEVGDWVYDRAGHQHRYIKQFDALAKDGGDCSDHCVKILAFSRHFHEGYLEMIKDGRLRHGDRVLIECESYGVCEGCNKVGLRHCAHADSCGNNTVYHAIRYDTQGYIVFTKAEETPQTSTFSTFDVIVRGFSKWVKGLLK